MFYLRFLTVSEAVSRGELRVRFLHPGILRSLCKSFPMQLVFLTGYGFGYFMRNQDLEEIPKIGTKQTNQPNLVRNGPIFGNFAKSCSLVKC